MGRADAASAAVESADYHVTTSQHARAAEDENDAKVEGDRRSRTRGGKTTKQKKGNKLSESKRTAKKRVPLPVAVKANASLALCSKASISRRRWLTVTW